MVSTLARSTRPLIFPPFLIYRNLGLSTVILNILFILVISLLFSSLCSVITECSEPLELALQRQWLDLRLCTKLTNQSALAVLNKINQSLTSRTFLASDKLTLVDILWALSLIPVMVSLTIEMFKAMIASCFCN